MQYLKGNTVVFVRTADGFEARKVSIGGQDARRRWPRSSRIFGRLRPVRIERKRRCHAPTKTVELLRNGDLHDRAVADQSGQFVMVPPRFPSGTYDLTLRSKQPDGKQATPNRALRSRLSRARPTRPVVALMTPGKPTVVLSQPSAPKPMAGAVVVESVEIEPGGKFHASGRTQQPQLAIALLGGGSPSTMILPKIATTTVSRGDSLWRLSRLRYGVGTRYAVTANPRGSACTRS